MTDGQKAMLATVQFKFDPTPLPTPVLQRVFCARTSLRRYFVARFAGCGDALARSLVCVCLPSPVWVGRRRVSFARWLRATDCSLSLLEERLRSLIDSWLARGFGGASFLNGPRSTGTCRFRRWWRSKANTATPTCPKRHPMAVRMNAAISLSLSWLTHPRRLKSFQTSPFFANTKSAANYYHSGLNFKLFFFLAPSLNHSLSPCSLVSLTIFEFAYRAHYLSPPPLSLPRSLALPLSLSDGAAARRGRGSGEVGAAAATAPQKHLCDARRAERLRAAVRGGQVFSRTHFAEGEDPRCQHIRLV